jgi:VIT1/CCC1 family predicted Fe2+/Mn2+ transporter
MNTPPPKDQKRNDFLTDIVIGLSDGLIVPFALATGISGVVTSNVPIYTTGIAAIAAGAVVMALSGYYAGKSEMDRSTSKVTKHDSEEAKIGGIRKEHVKAFFANIDLSEELQEKAAEEILSDKKQWADFIKEYELGADQTDPARAAKSAWNIGFSYIAGGLVPLSPYIFTNTPIAGFKVSVVLTLTCLFIFGFIKSKIIGLNPVWGATRFTLTGALAAAAAFAAAKLLE